jgi:hypothetical protein
MRVKVDSGQLKRAARAVVALNSFAKEKKDASKEEKDTFPCLLTARGKYLYVESAVFGLYLKYRIDAEVKAEGKFSTVAAPLQHLPDNETIELSRVVKSEGKGKAREQKAALCIKRQNSTYTLSEVAHAEEAVLAGRVYDRKRIKNNCATLPFAALKEAINSVTFSPGLPTETLRLQIRLSKSHLEVSGRDTFALAKFSLHSREIRVKRTIEAVVKTGLLRLLTKEAGEEEGESSVLGLLLDQDKQPVALYLGTARMELWHPVLGVPYRDPGQSIKNYFESNRVRATFAAQNRELQSALNTVTALWVGESSNSVDVSVNRGAVSIEANIAGQHSDTVLLTEGKIRAKREQNFSAPVQYLMAFAKLSPATALLKVSVCGEEIVHIASQLEKSKQLEFVLSQAGHETEGESES